MTSLYRFCSIALFCAAALVSCQSADAQGWGWGNDRGRDNSRYGDDEDYDRPPPPSNLPYMQQNPPGYGQQQNGRTQPGYAANPRCRELELQLSNGGSPNSNADQLARLDNDIRQADIDFRRIQADADRANCYDDMFLFGRTLRQSPRCNDLDHQVQLAKSKLAQMKAQRDMLARGNTGRGHHEEILAELARNRCGDSYARQYEQQQQQQRTRSSSSSFFSFFSNDDGEEENANARHYSAPTYAATTIKTMCVRLCDGFYFPISYATSEDKLTEDSQKCQSQCAAPAELYHAHSDQEAEQMVSMTGKAYTALPNAFRNRKAYIRGCSCNASEYSQTEIAKSEETLRTQGQKRADATPISRGKPGDNSSKATPPTANTPSSQGGSDGATTPATGQDNAQSTTR